MKVDFSCPIPTLQRFKTVFSKTNIFKLICYLLTNQRLLVHRGYFDLSTFTILKRAYPTCAVNCAICQPPDRVSNVKRGAPDILQNTLICWENCICPFYTYLGEKGKVFRRVDTSLYYLLSNIYGKSPYILDMILGYLLILLAFE